VSDSELQGWYHQNRTSQAVRVRLLVTGASLSLQTLSGKPIASWSLDRLENREIPVLGTRWSVGDSLLPEAFLVVDSDDDYRALRQRSTSASLQPVRARLWHQAGFSMIESGNLTGWPVWVLLLVASAVAALWQLS
jgi:hypothetical protein